VIEVTGAAPSPSAVPRFSRRLATALVGLVPILWNNADIDDLGAPVPAQLVLDDAARLGYAGVQDGVGFPPPTVLAAELKRRGLRLAEVYVAMPCGPDGPTPDALDAARQRLARLHAAGGDVVTVALGMSAGRVERAGRATEPDTPVLSERGWKAVASTAEALAREARTLGHALAFHSHAGTYVETPAELERLAQITDPALVRFCLDTGHVTLGGGDPVELLRRYGERVVHVHLKDVAPEPLARLRDGAIAGFFDALRARIFTELGHGVIDLAGAIDALAERDYAGWLMVEQDSSWLPPAESAAIGRRVLEFALRTRAGRQA
jgi:inosose dehydratase